MSFARFLDWSTTSGLKLSRRLQLLQETWDAVVRDLQHEAAVDDAVP